MREGGLIPTNRAGRIYLFPLGLWNEEEQKTYSNGNPDANPIGHAHNSEYILLRKRCVLRRLMLYKANAVAYNTGAEKFMTGDLLLRRLRFPSNLPSAEG